MICVNCTEKHLNHMVTEDAFWQFHVKRWEYTTYGYYNLQQGAQVLDCNLIYLKGSELRDAEFNI